MLDAAGVNDGGTQTAPRTAAEADDDDTLPRTDVLEVAPGGEVLGEVSAVVPADVQDEAGSGAGKGTGHGRK